MGWFLTVKELKTILNKYDDKAVVMIGMDRDEGESVEADPDVSYMYRTPDGELVDEMSAESDESLIEYRRALIIWGFDK